MNIRRTSIVAVLAGMLLSACAGAVTPAEPPATARRSAVTPRTSASISFMIFGDAAEKAAYEKLVAAFEERHPHIDVAIIHIPGQSDYRQRLGVDFAAGEPADVVLLNYRRYAAFAAKGVLEPLGPYLERSTLLRESDFFPEAIAPFRWQGQLMCIPQNLSSLVVYYNRDLFRAAGLADPASDWTWEDFLGAAQALTGDQNGDGQIDQYGLGTEVSIFRIAPFIWQNAGDLVDNPLAPRRLAIDTPEAREALQWFVDLQARHGVTPDAEAEAVEDSESRFLNGRLGMFLNSRRGVPTYRTIERFDWDVAPLPRGKQRAGILHADAYCMPSASRNKDAIWTFIEFANAVEGQHIIAASGRTVPSLRSVADSPTFLDPGQKPANSRVFLDVIPFIRGVPVMETWVDIEDITAQEFTRAYYGQAGLDEVIRTATERAQPYFTP